MARPIMIDAHMHIYESKAAGERQKAGYQIWEYGAKPGVSFSCYSGDVADVVIAMRQAGYAHAVSVNLFAVDLARDDAIAALPHEVEGAERAKAIAEIDATMGDRLRAFNLWACRVARTHPEITPYVAVDPSALSPEDNVAHLRELAERHGARGVKLHPVVQRFSPDDPRMLPIYHACVELGLVVLSHSGAAKGPTPYAEPRLFAQVLRRFPDLTLVLAHLGGGSWRQTVELSRAFPNVCFDCCEILEWTGAPNAPTDEQLARLIKEVGPDRVMLGTDFPWYDLDRTVERVMALPLLSQDEKEGILGTNAIRILRLRP
jgi:predicted TIM-barrel fold metal-dependent hydrolase